VEEWADLRFIMATLDYLEKNKDIFPDTYEKAQKAYKDDACEVSQDESQFQTNDHSTCDPNTEKATHSAEAILLGLSLLEKRQRIKNRNFFGKKY